MSRYFGKKFVFFFSFLLLFSLLFSHVFYNAAHMGGEALEDLFFVQSYIFSLIKGIIPTWDPYTALGQSFFVKIIYLQYAPIDTLWGILLNIYYHIFGDFELMPAVSPLIYIYVTIFGCGLFYFFKFYHPNANRFVLFFFCVFCAFIVNNFAHKAGTYIITPKTISFFPFCLYFISRFVEKTDKTSLLGTILSTSLLLLHGLLYVVPLSLVLLSYFVILALCKIKVLALECKNLLCKHPFFTITSILLGLTSTSYIVYTFIYEWPLYLREGRDLTHVTFEKFISVQKGHSFEFFKYFLPNNQMFAGLLSVFFFFVGVISFFRRDKIRKFLPLTLFLIFLSSIALGINSPFLALYYKYLFPGLKQVFYTAIFYDSSVIFYLLIALSGYQLIIKLVNQKLLWTLVLTAALPLYLSWSWINALPNGEYITIGIGAWLIFAYLARLTNRKIKNLILVIPLLVIFYEIYYPFIADRARILNTTLTHDSNPALHVKASEDYLFAQRRISRRTSPVETWGIIVPLLLRLQTYPFPLFLFSKNYKLLNDLLDEKGKLIVFGVNSNIIQITENPVYANSVGEAKIFLLADPNSQVVLKKEGTTVLTKTAKNVQEKFNSRFSVDQFSINQLTLSAELNRPALLSYGDSYHDDWRVYVDGQRRHLENVNIMFKGVFLPAGRHQVTFEFLPVYFYFSFILAYISLIAMVSLFIYYKAQQLRFEKSSENSSA